MNEKLHAAIARLSALTEDQQEAAADLLLDFLDREEAADLTAEDLAEIERFLEEAAAERLVKDFFERAKPQRDRGGS
jgi:hypothetical protein